MAVMETDRARAEEFGGRLVGTVNGAWFALAIGVGHRTGLYDALAGLEWATSEEIAERTGLQERYVREWLAGQLAGGIVERDSRNSTWRLPPEHATSLTREAGAGNLALLAAGLCRFGELEDDVVHSFREGGGVSWTRMDRVQEWQSELSYAVFASTDAVLALVPGLEERLRSGIDVVDVGCGRGHAALRIADNYPASRVVGYDHAPVAIGTLARRQRSVESATSGSRFGTRHRSSRPQSTSCSRST